MNRIKCLLELKGPEIEAIMSGNGKTRSINAQSCSAEKTKASGADPLSPAQNFPDEKPGNNVHIRQLLASPGEPLVGHVKTVILRAKSSVVILLNDRHGGLPWLRVHQ